MAVRHNFAGQRDRSSAIYKAMKAALSPTALHNWLQLMGVEESWGKVSQVIPPIAANQPIREVIEVAVTANNTLPPPPILPISTEFDMPRAKANHAPIELVPAKDLAELRQALEAFDKLHLKFTATQMVFSDGNPAARVMVIGEAPGAEEDKQGKPFVGMSGQLLDRMLGTVGLNRKENIYITNVVNWRPPNNRTPTPQEIALSIPFLHRHIRLIDPAVLVLVGGVAAKGVLDTNQGITKLRGQFQQIQIEDKIYPVLVTFHPAYLLRAPGQKAFAWRDWLTLQAYLRQHP